MEQIRIVIYPHNAEKLLKKLENKTSPTQYINEVIEELLKGKLIKLDEENHAVITSLANSELQKTSDEIVNYILSSHKYIVEIEQEKPKFIIPKNLKNKKIKVHKKITNNYF